MTRASLGEAEVKAGAAVDRLLTRTKAIPPSEGRAERPFPSHLGPASAPNWKRGNEEHSLPSPTRPGTQRLGARPLTFPDQLPEVLGQMPCSLVSTP